MVRAPTILLITVISDLAIGSNHLDADAEVEPDVDIGDIGHLTEEQMRFAIASALAVTRGLPVIPEQPLKAKRKQRGNHSAKWQPPIAPTKCHPKVLADEPPPPITPAKRKAKVANAKPSSKKLKTQQPEPEKRVSARCVIAVISITSLIKMI